MQGGPKSYAYLAATNDSFTLPAGTYLWFIDVGTATATSVVTVYNNNAASGEVVALIDAATIGSHQYGGMRFPKGLTVKMTTAAAKVTVAYS